MEHIVYQRGVSTPDNKLTRKCLKQCQVVLSAREEGQKARDRERVMEREVLVLINVTRLPPNPMAHFHYTLYTDCPFVASPTLES